MTDEPDAPEKLVEELRTWARSIGPSDGIVSLELNRLADRFEAMFVYLEQDAVFRIGEEVSMAISDYSERMECE